MAFHDCDVEEADILEVQSVSDMFSAFKTPAADAVKLLGGDDIAVFSPQLGLMVVTSQYDLEEPATTSQTVILSLADAECTWPDPPEYISDIVFECRWPSGANLVTEFQTFSDENATPSPSLEHYRERFSEGGICTIISLENSSILTCPVTSGAGGYALNRVEGRDIDREIGGLTGHAACIAVDVPTWCRIAGDPLDAVTDALADLLDEVPDGARGFKRLADAALAASCATLSPNTADPCLVARLAAESRERSRSLTDPGTQARGAKRAAGSSAQDGAAGRGPAL